MYSIVLMNGKKLLDENTIQLMTWTSLAWNLYELNTA
jgi:hypothetical protein